MSEYYLMHSGRSKRDGAKIGSGRYPLGSGARPFQGEAGEARRKGFLGLGKKKKVAAPKEPLTDEEKQKIIGNGDIRKAYDNKQFLTNADIDAVIDRYTRYKKLADLLPKKKSGLDFINKGQNYLESSSKFINSGVNVWNAIARIDNSVNPDSGMIIIPSIGELTKKS